MAMKVSAQRSVVNNVVISRVYYAMSRVLTSEGEGAMIQN